MDATNFGNRISVPTFVKKNCGRFFFGTPNNLETMKCREDVVKTSPRKILPAFWELCVSFFFFFFFGV